MSHYYENYDAQQKLKELRKAVRELLRGLDKSVIQHNPNAVDGVLCRLIKLSGYRG